jgi:hypothetical protein
VVRWAASKCACCTWDARTPAATAWCTFPDVKVVATSDAVTTGATGPLADYAGGGSFVGFAPVLDAMLKLDFDTAIPGRRTGADQGDVQAFRTKIGTVIDARRRW